MVWTLIKKRETKLAEKVANHTVAMVVSTCHNYRMATKASHFVAHTPLRSLLFRHAASNDECPNQ
jgi:hypothetical protein